MVEMKRWAFRFVAVHILVVVLTLVVLILAVSLAHCAHV